MAQSPNQLGVYRHGKLSERHMNVSRWAMLGSHLSQSRDARAKSYRGARRDVPDSAIVLSGVMGTSTLELTPILQRGISHLVLWALTKLRLRNHSPQLFVLRIRCAASSVLQTLVFMLMGCFQCQLLVECLSISHLSPWLYFVIEGLSLSHTQMGGAGQEGWVPHWS